MRTERVSPSNAPGGSSGSVGRVRSSSALSSESRLCGDPRAISAAPAGAVGTPRVHRAASPSLCGLRWDGARGQRARDRVVRSRGRRARGARGERARAWTDDEEKVCQDGAGVDRGARGAIRRALTAESDSVSDWSASLGKSTSSSQVGAAPRARVAGADMFEIRHSPRRSPVGSTRGRGTQTRALSLAVSLRAGATRASEGRARSRDSRASRVPGSGSRSARRARVGASGPSTILVTRVGCSKMGGRSKVASGTGAQSGSNPQGNRILTALRTCIHAECGPRSIYFGKV